MRLGSTVLFPIVKGLEDDGDVSRTVGNVRNGTGPTVLDSAVDSRSREWGPGVRSSV